MKYVFRDLDAQINWLGVQAGKIAAERRGHDVVLAVNSALKRHLSRREYVRMMKSWLYWKQYCNELYWGLVDARLMRGSGDYDDRFPLHYGNYLAMKERAFVLLPELMQDDIAFVNRVAKDARDLLWSLLH